MLKYKLFVYFYTAILVFYYMDVMNKKPTQQKC